MIPTRTWSSTPACKGKPTEWWFPDLVVGGAFTHKREHLRAIEICNTCPVQVECLNQAIEDKELYGIWGGLWPSQRRRFATCRHCGGQVPEERAGHGKAKPAVYCSDSCQRSRACPICGQGFDPDRDLLGGQARGRHRLYCSTPCQDKANTQQRRDRYPGHKCIAEGCDHFLKGKAKYCPNHKAIAAERRRKFVQHGGDLRSGH